MNEREAGTDGWSEVIEEASLSVPLFPGLQLFSLEMRQGKSDHMSLNSIHSYASSASEF